MTCPSQQQKARLPPITTKISTTRWQPVQIYFSSMQQSIVGYVFLDFPLVSVLRSLWCGNQSQVASLISVYGR